MAVEIPTDAIKQLQISLRNQAKMSSYDPDDTPLANLPSPEDTISEVDPSPPYLRCKHCKGRLLRGVASLICVFCGGETCKDLPPDPINFRNTLGFQWLLKSLALTGSEIVDQPTEANESSRGQAASKEELTLSELLSVEIRWTSKFAGTGSSDEKTPTRPKSFLDLAGVNLGSFFSEGEKDAALSTSEEPFEPSTRIATTESSSFECSENISLFASEESFDLTKPTATAESNAFKGGENLSFFAFEPGKQIASAESSAFHGSENLSLFASEKPFESSKQITTAEGTAFQGNETLSMFENVESSETDVKSTQGESGHSISSWPASLQSAASENLPQESKSLDPLVGSIVDLSAHIDTVFGSVGDSTKVKSNHSASTSNDWFSDDLLSISNSGLAGQPQPLESLATVKDGIIAENENNLHSTGIDWVEDTQWQTTSKDARDNKIADEDDDSFGAWNDFTSLSSAQNPSSSSKQIVDQTTLTDETSMTDLFSIASNSQADDSFGAWNDFTSFNSAQNASSSFKQTVDQMRPADETSVTDLFSTATDSQDLDFGSFLQPDLSAGATSSSHGSTVVNITRPEASAFDRMADVGTKDEDAAKDEVDVFSAKAGSKSDDVEKIMSQMHDLSFMLESNLSIPPKRDVHSLSQDHT
ncbi:PREDICTED: uncharacterized protein LOC101297479 isoform X1 [Fragaria vesca subsp. vesca]|uniref:uncharacterized protein LOC101297479 isoform X1 n=1 Tax=Fragaria vesca subsp. vesca TaxID=101020 RepID=UPI0002C2F07E|nr:PREDICTED: uncharacterized protein LOC101297479 isoform X1 [Fragaria vesca subsp. vesca]